MPSSLRSSAARERTLRTLRACACFMKFRTTSPSGSILFFPRHTLHRDTWLILALFGCVVSNRHHVVIEILSPVLKYHFCAMDCIGLSVITSIRTQMCSHLVCCGIIGQSFQFFEPCLHLLDFFAHSGFQNFVIGFGGPNRLPSAPYPPVRLNVPTLNSPLECLLRGIESGSLDLHGPTQAVRHLAQRFPEVRRQCLE